MDDSFEDIIRGKRVVPLTRSDHADLQYKLEKLLEVLIDMQEKISDIEEGLERVEDCLDRMEEDRGVEFRLDEEEEGDEK